MKGPIAELIAGALLPNYKHLYILGSLQVRYGFGPLVTPYTRVICKMIEVQDRLRLPIGRVLQSTGQRVPKTHLADPFKSLRDLRRAERVLRWLPVFERIFLKRAPEASNEPLEATAPQTDELKVY